MEKFLTIKDVVAYAREKNINGMRNPNSVKKLIESGKLPAIDFGVADKRFYKVKESDLVKFIF